MFLHIISSRVIVIAKTKPAARAPRAMAATFRNEPEMGQREFTAEGKVKDWTQIFAVCDPLYHMRPMIGIIIRFSVFK